MGAGDGVQAGTKAKEGSPLRWSRVRHRYRRLQQSRKQYGKSSNSMAGPNTHPSTRSYRVELGPLNDGSRFSFAAFVLREGEISSPGSTQLGVTGDEHKRFIANVHVT